MIILKEYTNITDILTLEKYQGKHWDSLSLDE